MFPWSSNPSHRKGTIRLNEVSVPPSCWIDLAKLSLFNRACLDEPEKKNLLSLSNDRSVIGMIIFGRSIEWSGLNSKVGVRILGYLPGPLLFGKVSYGHMLLPVLWESLTDGWLQSSVFTTWVEVIAEYSFPLLKKQWFWSPFLLILQRPHRVFSMFWTWSYLSVYVYITGIWHLFPHAVTTYL